MIIARIARGPGNASIVGRLTYCCEPLLVPRALLYQSEWIVKSAFVVLHLIGMYGISWNESPPALLLSLLLAHTVWAVKNSEKERRSCESSVLALNNSDGFCRHRSRRGEVLWNWLLYSKLEGWMKLLSLVICFNIYYSKIHKSIVALNDLKWATRLFFFFPGLRASEDPWQIFDYLSLPRDGAIGYDEPQRHSKCFGDDPGGGGQMRWLSR